MGERGHGRDEGGLMVGRQLQRAGDRAGLVHQCYVCPDNSSWPLCFPTDVATSGPALLYSPSALYQTAPRGTPPCSPSCIALVRKTTASQPRGDVTWGLQQHACGSQGQRRISDLKSKASQVDTRVMQRRCRATGSCAASCAAGAHGPRWS